MCSFSPSAFVAPLPTPCAHLHRFSRPSSSTSTHAPRPRTLLHHRARRAYLVMSLGRTPPNSTNSTSSNNKDNDSDPSETLPEDTSPLSDDDAVSNSNSNSNSPSSSSQCPSAEFRFSQEVLRRRMAALNKNTNNPLSNSVLDLSVLGDAQYDFDESTFDDDDNVESVISQNSMSEEQADRFIHSFGKLARVWVIMFTNARDDTDGVYSLSVGNDNIVLAFQERYEANRYALCLEAQKFPQPQICSMDPNELQTFCVDAGLKLGYIPSGMVITPPEESVIDDLDKWRGKPSSEQSTGMTDEDIDAMRKRLDSLFGQ